MRSLHRPGSRRSSNKESKDKQPYMDGWTNTLSHESHTARTITLDDMRIAWPSVLIRACVRYTGLRLRARARSRTKPLHHSHHRGTIDHHPRSTSTISDMVANICRAKHTNTIQCCLPTASGAQPVLIHAAISPTPFVIAHPPLSLSWMLRDSE